MKKKKQPQKISVLGFAGVILLGVFGAAFLVLFTLYTSREPIPPTHAPPTPTFELLPGETLLYISTKLPMHYDENLSFGGGTAGILDYVDDAGVKQTGMTMYIHVWDATETPAEIILVYAGKSWRYKEYHLRVLSIMSAESSKGMSLLAIRKEN